MVIPCVENELEVECKKRCKRSSRNDDLDFFVVADTGVTTSKSPLELEIQAYREVSTGEDENVDDDPEKFWVVNSGKFPVLKCELGS